MPPGTQQWDAGGGSVGPMYVVPVTAISGAYQMSGLEGGMIRIGGGLTPTVTLPGSAAGTARPGQRFTIINFVVGGLNNQILPGAGDNIEGGTVIHLPLYGDRMTLVNRMALPNPAANWLLEATTTTFFAMAPVQPTLAPGAQGPISCGAILVPGGVRSLAEIQICTDAVLTGSQLTVAIGGHNAAISLTVGNNQQAARNPQAPGAILTIPNANTGIGTFCPVTVTTTAGFSGATTVAVSGRWW